MIGSRFDLKTISMRPPWGFKFDFQVASLARSDWKNWSDKMKSMNKIPNLTYPKLRLFPKKNWDAQNEQKRFLKGTKSYCWVKRQRSCLISANAHQHSFVSQIQMCIFFKAFHGQQNFLDPQKLISYLFFYYWWSSGVSMVTTC